MTLVGLEESSHGFGMMLSVQSQQQQYHVAAHRGNVIVTAAAAANNNNNNNNNNGAETKQQQQQQQSQAQQKRKMYAQATPQYSPGGQQPASVARRNARERNRVKQVNNGFATLRQHIPQSLAQALGSNTAGTHGGARAGSKKLSKVETLRMAVEYIRNLQQLLDENDSEAGGSSCASSSGSPPPATPSHSSQSLGSPVMEMHHHHQRLHQHPEIKFELKCESSDDDVHDLVNHHHHHSHLHHHQHHQQLQYQQLQPVGHQQQSSPVYTPAPCSEASSSPTPSFVSEASSTGGSQGYGNFSGPIYTSHNDGYDNYEPMSPEDEELLECISLWQQGQ